MLLVHAESSRVLDELIARHHRPDLMKKFGRQAARDHPARLHRGRGDPAGDHLVRGHRRPAVHRPHVDRQGDRAGQAAASEGRRRRRRDLCPVSRPGRFGSSKAPTATSSPAARRSRPGPIRIGSGRALPAERSRVVSTDTCTFTREQKSQWEGDCTKIPMGLPGLETLLPIVYTRGVLAHRLTLEQMVEKCSSEPFEADGPLPAQGRDPARQRRRPRADRPVQDHRGRSRDAWKRTPTGTRIRAGSLPDSRKRLTAGAARSSTIIASSASAAGAAGSPRRPVALRSPEVGASMPRAGERLTPEELIAEFRRDPPAAHGRRGAASRPRAASSASTPPAPAPAHADRRPQVHPPDPPPRRGRRRPHDPGSQHLRRELRPGLPDRGPVRRGLRRSHAHEVARADRPAPAPCACDLGSAEAMASFFGRARHGQEGRDRRLRPGRALLCP